MDAAAKSDGKLEIVEADLLKKDAFHQAAEGCELIIHTASPFFTSNIKDSQAQLIKPAKEGTRNVLQAGHRPSLSWP